MFQDRNGNELNIGDVACLFNVQTGDTEDVKIHSIFDHLTESLWVIRIDPLSNQKCWTVVFARELVCKEPSKETKSVLINDHVCPTCNNDRLSKTEKSCWRCGNPC
jgi:hypothetical protein